MRLLACVVGRSWIKLALRSTSILTAASDHVAGEIGSAVAPVSVAREKEGQEKKRDLHQRKRRPKEKDGPKKKTAQRKRRPKEKDGPKKFTHRPDGITLNLTFTSESVFVTPEKSTGEKDS